MTRQNSFKQQRLKSWQPLLTPKLALPIFLLVGLVFIPLGIVLVIYANQVKQVLLDYTDCNKATNTLTEVNVHGIKRWSYSNGVCLLEFDLPEMKPPVYLFYRLTYFYQNNRKYTKSFDASQLSGSTWQYDTQGQVGTALTAKCGELSYLERDWTITQGGVNTTIKKGTAQIYPCGLIANSMFSDSVGLLTQGDKTFVLDSSKITWATDGKRFGISDYITLGKNSSIPTSLVPPPLWRQLPQWANGYNATNLPDLSTWQPFQVWMRTSAFPTFRKPMGKYDTQLSGTFQLAITYNFDISTYGSRKSIVFSTASVFGGKNDFLGVAFIVVGCIYWFVGFLFLFKQYLRPRKLGDQNYLSWNLPKKLE